MLKPQDLLVAIQVALWRGRAWRYEDLSHSLGLSQSESHKAVARAQDAGLLVGRRADRGALLEFIEHGVRRAFYTKRGPSSRGVPTGAGAPPLNRQLSSSEIPVWPHSEGRARGYAIKPLYKSVPKAALEDPELYEALALLDAIRDGGARERRLAMKALRERLGQVRPGENSS